VPTRAPTPSPNATAGLVTTRAGMLMTDTIACSITAATHTRAPARKHRHTTCHIHDDREREREHAHDATYAAHLNASRANATPMYHMHTTRAYRAHARAVRPPPHAHGVRAHALLPQRYLLCALPCRAHTPFRTQAAPAPAYERAATRHARTPPFRAHTSAERTCDCRAHTSFTAVVRISTVFILSSFHENSYTCIPPPRTDVLATRARTRHPPSHQAYTHRPGAQALSSHHF
jgi:hypothetical protein